MKIEKYKKLKNGKYELIIEGADPLELYEETILEYNLLLTKNIEYNSKEILDYDKKCETYHIGLKYLKNRARSKRETYQYLISKDYPKDAVTEAIDKLTKQGYINDEVYARSFLHDKIITTSSGPYKIKNDLLKKGVDNDIVYKDKQKITLTSLELKILSLLFTNLNKVVSRNDIIDKVLLEYDLDTQIEKINKYINKIIKSNRTKSNKLLKIKIVQDLTTQGFAVENIKQVLSNVEFPQNDNIAKKEYDKLYKKLSKKYSGETLELKIKQKMYQKGFDYK